MSEDEHVAQQQLFVHALLKKMRSNSKSDTIRQCILKDSHNLAPQKLHNGVVI